MARKIRMRKMQKEEAYRFGTVIGGAFTGAAVDAFSGYVDKSAGVTANTWYKRYSTWINIGGGLGLTLAPLFANMKENVENFMTAMGAYLIASKTADIVKEVAGFEQASAMVRKSPIPQQPLLKMIPQGINQAPRANGSIGVKG